MSLLSSLKHLLIKDTRYVSETDKLLREFDRKNPRKSKTQLAEIAKHRDIFHRSVEDRIDW